MDFKKIQELIKLIGQTEVAELKIEEGDFKISIRNKNFAGTKTTQMVSMAPVAQTGIPVQAVQPAAAAPPAAANADASAEKPPADAASDNLIYIKSPMVGTFYRSSSPDKPPYIKIGDSVTTGTVVCVVEAMKLFNEIESEISGKVVEVLVEDATPVEYDQPLYAIDPNG